MELLSNAGDAHEKSVYAKLAKDFQSLDMNKRIMIWVDAVNDRKKGVWKYSQRNDR